jgi:hypothetical protein
MSATFKPQSPSLNMLDENKPQQEGSTPISQTPDPLAAARERSHVAHKQLITSAGGCYNSSEAAKLLGVSETQLDALRTNGKIIGLPVDSQYLYPKWQITKRFLFFHQILPHLEAVLERLGDHSPWTKAAFMLDRQIRPEFPTPLAGLQMGKVDLVLAAAESFATHGAS